LGVVALTFCSVEAALLALGLPIFVLAEATSSISLGLISYKNI